MKIIGLTGGIGSGKSSVLEIFKKIGISTYNADESAKKLISSDKKIIHSIKQLFGEDIYNEKELKSKLVSKLSTLPSDFTSFISPFDRVAMPAES